MFSPNIPFHQNLRIVAVIRFLIRHRPSHRTNSVPGAALLSVWSVLHLSFIFDLDDEPICEDDAEPTFRHSFPVAQETHVRVSQPHDRAA